MNPYIPLPGDVHAFLRERADVLTVSHGYASDAAPAAVVARLSALLLEWAAANRAALGVVVASEALESATTLSAKVAACVVLCGLYHREG